MSVAAFGERSVFFRGPWRGWAFSAIWLVYLYYPLDTIVMSDHEDSAKVVGVASLVVFAAVYVTGFWVFRDRMFVPKPANVLRQYSLLLVLAALLVPASFTARESILAGTIYIAVTAMFALPLRHAVLVIGLLAVAVVVVPRVTPGWTPDDSTVFALVTSTFVAWGIGQLIGRNIELMAARARIADLAIIEERERMGRDMHDILGHTLTVITVKAELARRLVDIDPARAAQEIEEVETLSRSALADVRATVGGTRQVSLESELVNAATALAAAGVQLTTTGSQVDVDDDLRELFGWTLREAVTNIVRHSGATHCRVTLTGRSIAVVDDGHGISGSAAKDRSAAGNGLRGLGERARHHGASLSIADAPSGGVGLTVEALR